MKEDVRIVILTYNRLEWVEECIKSFLAQTYKDFNLIVLDNASDQDVEKVIGARYKDPRLSFIRNKEHLKIEESFNKAWTLASGDFFMLFHDDDCAHPRLIEAQMKAFHDVPEAVFVVTGCEIVNDHSKMLQFDSNAPVIYDVFENHEKLIMAYIKRQEPFGFGATLYRTKFVKNTESLRRRLTEKFDLCSERPFLVTLAENGTCVYLKHPNYNVREHSSQDSKRLVEDKRYFIEALRFYREKIADKAYINNNKDFRNIVSEHLIGNYIFALKKNPKSFFGFFLKDIFTQDLMNPFCLLLICIKRVIGYKIHYFSEFTRRIAGNKK